MNTLTNGITQNRDTSIVVIEDNPDQWKIIQSVLASFFPEANPVWLSTFKQVSAYLKAGTKQSRQLPKLFFVDLYVPQRSVGWTILERLKTDPRYRAVPVIMLSSSDDKEDITESYMFRANSYIVKPTTVHEWKRCFQMLRYYWSDMVALPEIDW